MWALFFYCLPSPTWGSSTRLCAVRRPIATWSGPCQEPMTVPLTCQTTSRRPSSPRKRRSSWQAPSVMCPEERSTWCVVVRLLNACVQKGALGASWWGCSMPVCWEEHLARRGEFAQCLCAGRSTWCVVVMVRNVCVLRGPLGAWWWGCAMPVCWEEHSVRRGEGAQCLCAERSTWCVVVRVLNAYMRTGFNLCTSISL